MVVALEARGCSEAVRFLGFVGLPVVESKLVQMEVAAARIQHFSIAVGAGRDFGTAV